ncbi:MAG: cysteine desulfurase [Gemmatimonadales bacterium]|nr:cysteine desulfurase [Gemmatimonadales bacterium]
MTIAAVGEPSTVQPTTLDVDALRAEFPILAGSSRGKPLIYLDSAATTQKPQAVLDALSHFYASANANIHRGVYELSERATVAYDGARVRVAQFIGASNDSEVVFVRGTTEAINLVARSFPAITPGCTVVVSEMEHHANIVPWQLAGARTVPIPVTDSGELDMVAAEKLIGERPAMLAVVHVSNALGTVNPIAELCRMARAVDVPVLVDGAQAVGHFSVDVAALGCDFYCYSAHKLYGPTGIGVLWAKAPHLAQMPPWQGGGDMIDTVSFERTTFAPAPGKFEAGTPHIAGVIGMVAAIDWLERQDRDALHAHEADLLAHGTELLASIPGLRLVGTAADKIGVLTFTLSGVHPHDLASLLDADGICVRAGHHCTQPLHRRLGLPATTRASLAPYNTRAELDALAGSLNHAAELFAR